MRVLLRIALAAWAAGCSAHGPVGASWPRPAPGEVDGGESLAPRPAARAIAALVEEDKPADQALADKPAASAPTPVTTPGGDRAAPAPPPPSSEDPMTTEEIVIEVED
jgi:hypothetical protein